MILAQGQNQHLVICQQVFIDRLTKADTEDFRPVHGFVIHRAKVRIGILCLFLAFLGIQTRRCRHVQAFFCPNEGIVMHLHKGGIIFILQGNAGCSVRLIAYNQVKFPLKFFLGIGDNSNRLICGENNHQPFIMKFFGQSELPHNVRHPC